MNGINKVTVIGNIVRDAVLDTKTVENRPVSRCRFSVAVDSARSKDRSKVSYFEVTLWREYAEKMASWLKQGRQVYVTGSVELNQYTDAHGANKAVLQITNAEIVLLGKKPETQEMPVATTVAATEEDDLPF